MPDFVTPDGRTSIPLRVRSWIERCATCTVCGELGKSEHNGPEGDTFWLCAGCEEACIEVGREGQYVTEEEALNGL